MRALSLCSLASASVLALAAVARADNVVLAEGDLAVQLVGEVNLRPLFVGDPASLSPDLWLGVTRRLTVGFVHSAASSGLVAAGAGLCVRGCDDVVQTTAVDVRYAVDPRIALRGRALVRDFDPAKPAVAIGALVHWQRGRIGVTADPQLRLGLANRDRGNRDALALPVWLSVHVAPRWLAELHTGYVADLAVWSDGFHVPVGVRVAVVATPCVEVAGELAFANAIGPQIDGKDRTLIASMRWHRRGRR